MKRNKAQRETDLIRLSELVKEGKTQSEMALALGITQQQVSEDLSKLRPLWVEAARNVLEGTAIEAALKVREVAVGRYTDTGLASVRLRGAEAVLDRIGLPKLVKSENKHDFGGLSDDELIQRAEKLLGGVVAPGAALTEE